MTRRRRESPTTKIALFLDSVAIGKTRVAGVPRAVYADKNLDSVARAWVKAGFRSPEVVENWLRSDCTKPHVARGLKAFGVRAHQIRGRYVNKGYGNVSVCEMVESGLMSLNKAAEIARGADARVGASRRRQYRRQYGVRKVR